MKTFGGIVALLLALTACTGGDGGGTKDEPTAGKKTAKPKTLQRDTTAVTPAWAADLDPIGQPIVSGSTVVVIARVSGKRLEIVGIDSATGQKRWSHPFSPNYAVPGIPLVPQVSKTSTGQERVVFYLAPDKPSADAGDLLTPVVSVDPATGDIEQKSDRIEATEPVGPCDDGTDVCVKGAVGGDRTYTNLRFDLEKGTFAPSKDGAPKNARIIASAGFFSTNERPGEKLGVRRDGQTLWFTPLETLFGKGYTSDNGWAFVHEVDPDRYTGFVGQPRGKQDEKSQSAIAYDLARQKMISLSGKDGSVLWSRDGADSCFKPTDFDDEQAVSVIEHPVRCLESGVVTFVDDTSTPQGVTMTAEGYDPVTGETTWSHPIPDAAAAAYWQDTPRALVRGGKTIVLPLAEGFAIVDTATGKTSPVKDQVFFCQSASVGFDYVTPWLHDGEKVVTRHGTGLLSPCTADGAAVAGGAVGPTAAAVREAGVQVSDSTFVMATADGLVGYQLTGS